MMTQTSNKEALKEGTDLRRIVLMFISKVWLVAVITVVGVILGALCYKIYVSVVDKDTTYQISTDYKLEFNYDEFPNGMDYYNAYTWGQFVTDDKPVGYAMEAVAGLNASEIREAVSSEMLGDYRVLTVKTTGKDKSKVENISKAYETAMPMFADDIPEISSIELWSKGEIGVVNLHTRTASAAFLGGLVALLLAIFGFAFCYVLDDKIYTETDFKRYFADITFLGYDSDKYKADLEANRTEIIGDKNVVRTQNVSGDLSQIKSSQGCVIVIPWGKVSASALEYDFELLKKQGCTVLGVEMINCNGRFLKAYYAR